MRHVARWTILASCAALIPAFAHAQDATIKLPQDIAYNSRPRGDTSKWLSCLETRQSQVCTSCGSGCRPA